MAASGDRSNCTLPTLKNIAGDDQDRSKFRNYENLCLWDQAKRLEKLLFAAMNAAAFDGIAHRLFSCYHSQRLLFSHSKNNFSTTLTPTEKPRCTYCRVFIVDSICSTTIDIITNNNLFSIFKLCVMPGKRLTVPICRYRSSRAAGCRYHFAGSVLAGPPANGTMLHKICSCIPG